MGKEDLRATILSGAPTLPYRFCGGISHSKRSSLFKSPKETSENGQKAVFPACNSSLKILGLENLMKIGRMVETIAGETDRFYFISGSVSLKLGETMTSPDDGMF